MPGGHQALVLLVFFVCVVRLGHSASSEATLTEDRVRATMLLQVLKFVEWPPQATMGSEPVRACVLGSGRFAETLKSVAADMTIGNRRVTVDKVERAADHKGCQVVYVAAASEREVQALLEDPAGQPLLTVGQADGFAYRGGMVNLPSDNGRIVIELNPDMSQKRGVRFSSKLMRLARLVSSPGER